MADEFGLGRFGDARLEKGGLRCIPRLLNGLARAFGDWREDARKR
jgi:hypothetical protein